MNVRWSPTARRDFADIFTFIDQRNPPAALRAGQAILDAARHLAVFPQLGRPGRQSGTRELVVVGTPIVIVYRIANDELQIVSAIHGARRWPPAKS